MADRPRLRCAIYTRKSSEEGLEQDFNSLEAQREACEAYVKSQSHEGWAALATRYDDGGYSGGNMERPGLTSLLDAVRAGHVDIIVVYKIDRLTRSLTDFAKLAELLDAHKVSFVSVTQQFNTTTSMGRLMLNVLLSFAQFEREITGERIRDKIAASKKKGMWMGGPIPFGYVVKDRQLVVHTDEAIQVRRIFDLYLETKTVPDLMSRLAEEDILTPERQTRKGGATGGRPFTRGHLYKFLSNPLYVGKVAHKGVVHDGQHDAIIADDVWKAVQEQLTLNTQGARKAKRSRQKALLARCLFDDTGRAFTLTHATKGSRKYQYYVNSRTSEGNSLSLRFPVAAIDRLATEAIQTFLLDEPALLRALQLGGSMAASALDRARQLRDGDLAQVASDLIMRAELNAGVLTLNLSIDAIADLMGAKLLGEVQALSLPVPLTFRRRGAQMKLVTRSTRIEKKADPALLLVVARAFDWFERLSTGAAHSIAELAKSDGFDAGYVSHVLRIAFLPPATVEAICSGSDNLSYSAKELVWKSEVPLLWK